MNEASIGGHHGLPRHLPGRGAEVVAKKLQKPLPVGQLPEDGHDLMLALARQVISGEEDDAETVEAAFAQARVDEAASEEFLVDGG